MNIKEQFLHWIKETGKYRDVNIKLYIEKYVDFLGFNPFELKDDLSDLNEVKKHITDNQNELLKQDAFITFNKASQSGVPTALMGKDNYFRFLNELASSTNSDSLNPIFDKVQNLLKNETGVLKDFTLQNRQKTFAWIADHLNVIGNNKLHYEIIKRYNKLSVELHFEGGVQGQKDIFQKTISELPDSLHWFDWHSSKSIKTSNSYNINDPDIAINLTNDLKALEENIGDNIRNILTNNVSQQLDKNMKNQPLNQILFGPPGTGKTYNTINKALEIIGVNIDGKSRKELKEIFEAKLKEKQIVFTTFHQSMNYEDFIEGIKPKTLENDVIYEVVPGLFKELCETAKSKKITTDNFQEVYGLLLKEIKNNDGKLVLTTTIQAKEFTIYVNSKDNLRFHANTEKAYEGVIKKDIIEYYLKTGEAIDWPSYTWAVGAYLTAKYGYSKDEKEESKNYVLIIDEINRGNVSQIFGELITLIEEDKRLEKPEALEVTLPYSKEKFGVPPNLYIIGTMNTADRSVEALDTALRRRFCFEEMPPIPQLLSPGYRFWDLLWLYEGVPWENKKYMDKEEQMRQFSGMSDAIWNKRKDLWENFKKETKTISQIENFPDEEFNGTNLDKLLRIINKRIEKLIDKDHQIGHSYFMPVTSLQGLQVVFYNKIIPLLQEYFFGDYGKIGLVIGEGFFEMENENVAFAKFNDYDASEFDDRRIYRLKDISKMKDDEFQRALDFLLK